MRIFKIWVIVLSLTLLAGCVNQVRIDPRVASLDKRILLTYGDYDAAGRQSLNQFGILLADKKVVEADNIFRNRGSYNGYIASLIDDAYDGGALGVVFRDGTVFKIDSPDFTALEPVYDGDSNLTVISAVKAGGRILALAKSVDGVWAFYELGDGGWMESNIQSPVLKISDIGIAELVEYESQPALFWREVTGRSVSGAIRGAVYDGSEWKYLPAIGMEYAASGGFAVCSEGDRILLIQDIGKSESNGGMGMPVSEYRRNDGWRSIADIPFSKESMALIGMGIDIKVVDDKFVVARADEAGVQVYYSVNIEDGIWKGIEQFEKEEKGLLEYLNSELIFNYILIVLSLVMLITLIRRRRRIRRISEGDTGSDTGSDMQQPKDARLARMLKEARLQRIGGYASVIDRGFALFIDGFFVMPVPYYYLNARSLEFMDSVFSANELVLFFVWLGALSVYLFVAELIFGQSIGKAVARIRVRKATGGRATWYQILLRNTARMIDFFPIPIGSMRIWYLVAAVSSSLNSRRQRVGDMLAKTVVRRYTPLRKRKIILASASPRRSELLTEYGLTFDIVPADVDESLVDNMLPKEFARMLAVRKADMVASGLQSGELVIAADTVVAHGSRILGKPVDDDDARSMLKLLSGNMHEVYTGVCIIDTATRQMLVSVERTEVEFRELSESEIDNYVASGEGTDKAGSYAVQGEGNLFVKAVLGSTSNVIGMPLELFSRMLKDLDAS